MAETAEQRIARITDEVVTGRRTLNSVRQSVDRLAGRPPGDYSGVDDSRWTSDPSAVAERIRAIFDNRGVALTTTSSQPFVPQRDPQVTPGPPPPVEAPPSLPNDSDLARDLAQRNTYEAVLAQFRRFGLDTLAPKILEYVQQGFDGNTISLLLQETSEYKTRFKANEARLKRGLSVLSPAEYISTESAYRAILRAAGMPPGFYDDVSDFQGWLEKDVAPQELSQRVEAANRLVLDTNPEVVNQLRRFYPELTQGDLIANILDPARAMPVIDKKIRAAEIGAAGKFAGFDVDTTKAEQWADRGVSYEQAQRGYGEISGYFGATQAISDRFGGGFTQADAEDESIEGLASARRKREQLNQKETALFEGGSGVQRDSLARRSSGAY